MLDSRLPKQIIYSQLQAGQQAPGGLKKRYKDNIKGNLNTFHINTTNREVIAQNRTYGETESLKELYFMKRISDRLQKTRISLFSHVKNNR